MNFAGNLPTTTVMRLRTTVVITSVIFSLFAAISFYQGSCLALFCRSRSPIVGAVLACFGAMFAFVAIYLWRLRRWARKAARLGIAFFMFVFVSCTYNPFSNWIDDYRAAYGVAPNYLIVSLISVSCIGVGFWCLRILGKFPEEFR
jgi:hypothetical protein